MGPMHEQKILVVERAIVNSGDAKEHGFGVNGGEDILRHGSEQNAVAGIDQTAGDEQLDVVIVEEKIGDRQRVGDHGQVRDVQELMGQRVGGRTAGEGDRRRRTTIPRATG